MERRRIILRLTDVAAEHDLRLHTSLLHHLAATYGHRAPIKFRGWCPYFVLAGVKEVSLKAFYGLRN